MNINDIDEIQFDNLYHIDDPCDDCTHWIGQI
jgi:hypothetical protein